MMNELVNEVASRTGLSPDQAQSAVTAAVEFLQARLPAPLGGALQSLLAGGSGDAGAGGGLMGTLEEGLEGKAMSALGGLFGSKG